MRVYSVYEETHSIQCCDVVTYLFHDCARSPWLFCLVCTCVWWSKYNTSRLTARRLSVLRACAMFDGLTEFCRFLRRVSICFSCQFAGFHVANRAVRRLLLLRICMKCVVHFCSEYSRAHPSTGRSGQVIDSVCMPQFSWRAWSRSAVRAQPWLLQRLLGLGLSHAVHWCVTHYRQAVCSEIWPVITL